MPQLWHLVRSCDDQDKDDNSDDGDDNDGDDNDGGDNDGDDNDGDDNDDEDKGRVDHLRHVPQEPHHVAQQIGFLRESFFALPGEKLV